MVKRKFDFDDIGCVTAIVPICLRIILVKCGNIGVLPISARIGGGCEIFCLILRDFLNMAKKIVIFDENELNTKLFHDLRESKGYDIIETRNGMEALKITREQKPKS